jgi:hypothetical protein
MPALTDPPTWNSAHRPIDYQYDFTSYAFSSVTDAGSDTINVFVTNVPDLANFTVGQRVYIASGVYAGNWVVVSIGGTSVVLNAPYVSTDADSMTPVFNVEAELWAGYPALNNELNVHPGYAIYPLKKIADIVAVPGLEDYATINVSGFIKGVFKKVTEPVIGADFSMSVPFKLVVSGETANTLYAVNGTFTSADLLTYSDSFEILNARTPIHFENGVCIYSMIWIDYSVNGRHIFNIQGTHGTGTTDGMYFSETKNTFIQD